MKHYITLLFLILIASVAIAQNNYQDVIYLKNGSVIRGVIVEQIPNKTVKIETADKNLFVFEMDEVLKMERVPLETESFDGISSENTPCLQEGYKGILDIGYQIGVGDYGIDRLALNFINGVQISSNFSLGLGTGLRFYSEAESLVIPIYFDFRVYFASAGITPYFSLDFGYSIDATNEFDGLGLLLNPSFGLSFNTENATCLHIGFGYEYQQIFSVHSDAISILIGISF